MLTRGLYDDKNRRLMMMMRYTSTYGTRLNERQEIIIVILFLNDLSSIVTRWLIQFCEVER